MPNYCDYTMRIRGKKEDRDKWVELMNNYELENHFFRIFETWRDNDWFDREDCEMVSGYCAWSIESCCRESGYSEGKDLLAINSRELNLDVEVWSEEPGCGFQEHYIYSKGQCLTAECKDLNVYIWDTEKYETWKEFKENNKIPDHIKEDDFEGDCYKEYYDGGFDFYMNWEDFPDTPDVIQILRRVEGRDTINEIELDSEGKKMLVVRTKDGKVIKRNEAR